MLGTFLHQLPLLAAKRCVWWNIKQFASKTVISAIIKRVVSQDTGIYNLNIHWETWLCYQDANSAIS